MSRELSKDEVIEILVTALEDAKKDLEVTAGENALAIIKRALKFFEWREKRCPLK